jgi:hypothetical protein
LKGDKSPHRNGFSVFETAPINQREANQIGGHIECKTVHGHPFTHAQAYGGDFLLTDPDAHMLGIPTGLHGEIRQGSNQHLFQVSDISLQIPTS